MSSLYFAEYYRWLLVHRYLPISADKATLLDVGCRDGLFLLRQPARLRVGLDMNPVPLPGRPALLIQADALHPPLPPASFDTIFAFDVVEHIVDDTRFLATLVDLLAPGGALWLSTPCAGYRIWPAFLTDRLNRSAGHVRDGYTEQGLRDKLPPGCQATFYDWNEPFLRTGYVFLHALALAWPWLGLRATAACAWLDHFFSTGHRGHLFMRVARPCAPTVSPAADTRPD